MRRSKGTSSHSNGRGEQCSGRCGGKSCVGSEGGQIKESRFVEGIETRDISALSRGDLGGGTDPYIS